MAALNDLTKRGSAILGVTPQMRRKRRRSQEADGMPSVTTTPPPSDGGDATGGTSAEEKMAALAVKAQQPLIDAQAKLLEAQAEATINPKNPHRIDASAPPSPRNSAASNMAGAPSGIAAMRAADPAWGTLEGRIANEKAVLGPEGGITAAQQAARGARVAAAVGAPGAPMGGDQWGPGVGRGINPIRPGTSAGTVDVNSAVMDKVRQAVGMPVAAPPPAAPVVGGAQPRKPKPRTGGQSAVVNPRPNPLFRRAE